jgi:ribonuclease HI
MHQQLCKIRGYPIRALKAKGHWCSKVHSPHRLQGSSRTNRKRMIARDAILEKYLALVRRMENYFKGFIVEHIERNKNTEADQLAKVAARNTPLTTDVFL